MRAAPEITLDTPIWAEVDLEAEDVRTNNGRGLTDEVVDEFVEAATEAHVVGRPSLSASGAHAPSVTVRLPEELNAKLDRAAARTGERRAQIVREALEAMHL